MPSDQVLALFKFGKRDDIDKFVRDGHLFMNTLKHFREREAADLLRSDKHEGIAHCVQADGAILRMQRGEEWVDIGTIRGQIHRSDGSEDTVNVFCMYAFRESAIDALVDPRNFEFGDTFVVLTDGDEFLHRVQAAADRESLKLRQGLVEYVDRSTYDGPMGIFRKFVDFSYQSEFRIAVVSGTQHPLSLKIGDLSDISMVGNLADLNQRIRIESSH